jgi:hypothetical protein
MRLEGVRGGGEGAAADQRWCGNAVGAPPRPWVAGGATGGAGGAAEATGESNSEAAIVGSNQTQRPRGGVMQSNTA